MIVEVEFEHQSEVMPLEFDDFGNEEGPAGPTGSSEFSADGNIQRVQKTAPSTYVASQYGGCVHIALAIGFGIALTLRGAQGRVERINAVLSNG
jgi:hypothetical protein